MNDPSLHGAAVYNPELLSKDELLRTFVARRGLLDRLLDDIRREGDTAPQHHLVVGRRGMGKTTLLHRLRYAVADDSELSGKWLALTFPEEQYNVAQMSDFWLNCIDALADHLDRTGQRALLESLDAEAERIQRQAEESKRWAESQALLLALADTLERRLILLLDNVDLVLDRLKSEEWTLREVLSAEPRLLLIGATANGLESSYNYGAAFYDFFKVHVLEGLNDAETFAVLGALADTHHRPGVKRLVHANPGRVRTLRLLAGGNPRTLTLLFNLWAQGVEGDVRSDLERLLDQCTPLYKHRFEDLPQQAQRVVDALALHWAPMTAADVAQTLNLEVNVVSAQLNALHKRQEVEKVELPDTRRLGFQLSERFFNIWYLMRASRRVRRRLVWLVEFLRLMYDQDTLAARGQRWLEDRSIAKAPADIEFTFALAEAIDGGPTRTALEHEGLKLLTAVAETRERLGEFLDLDGHDSGLRNRADRMRLLAEAKQAILGANRSEPEWDAPALWDLVGGSVWFTTSEKQEVARSAHSLSRSHLESLMRALTTERRRLTTIFGCTLDEFSALEHERREGRLGSATLLTGAKTGNEGRDISSPAEIAAAARLHKMPALLVVEGFLSEHLHSINPPALLNLDEPQRSVKAWTIFAEACEGDAETAVECYREAIRLDPRNADAHWRLGQILHIRLNRLSEAIDAYQKAIELGHNGSASWNMMAIALAWNGNASEAEAGFRNATQLDPEYSAGWSNLGRLLWNKGRSDEAIAAHRRALASAGKDPDVKSEMLATLAGTLVGLGEPFAEAESLALQSAKLKPDNFYSTFVLATITISEGRWSEAMNWIRRILTAPDSFLANAWSAILSLFKATVDHGHAGAALEFLAQETPAERWAPLMAALKVASEGRRDSLGSLATEVRQAADLVLAVIAPDLGPPPG